MKTFDTNLNFIFYLFFRYFGRGKDTDDEIDKENESADPLKNPSEPLQFQESSHKNENIKLSKFDNLSPPTKRTKFSFINFLDGQTKQSLADTSRTMTQNDEGVSHKITTDTTENKNLTTNDTKSLTVKERQPLSPKKIEQCQSSNQSNNDRISNVSVYNNKLNSKKISLAGRKSSTPTILQQFQRHKKVLKSTSPCNKELEDKEDTIEKVENREDKNPPEVNSSCSESNEFYREDHSVDNDNIVETKEEDKSVDGIKKKTSTIVSE